jgi:DUF917 family protein
MAPNMNRQIVVLLGMAVCLAVCPVTAANVSNVHVEQRKRLGCKVHKVAFKDKHPRLYLIAKRVFRVLPLRLVV